jgi:hypothetical protein
MFEHITVKATDKEAVLRFTDAAGTLGPTLHIPKRGTHDYAELWAPGGRLVGTTLEYTILGLLNAAVHGDTVLDD